MKIGDILICKKNFHNGDISFRINEEYVINDFHVGYINGIKSDKITHIVVTKKLGDYSNGYFTLDGDGYLGYLWYDYFYNQQELRLIKLNSL